LEKPVRLNQASDFALRILMLLAKEDEPMTVEEIARRLHLVKSHVMKIIAKLVSAGLLQSIRGRSGGISLARKPEAIFVGEAVRAVENDFAVVECMKNEASSCVFAHDCKLRLVMHEARAAFLDVLDKRNLKSIAVPLTLPA
jgi:Rrf2 family nitric oxide-sensitive transcriptional repressor